MESNKSHSTQILEAIERADKLGNIPVLPDKRPQTIESHSVPAKPSGKKD